MNFHHTYQSISVERNTLVSERLYSTRRIDLLYTPSNRFPKSIEDASYSPNTSTPREFERISLSPLSSKTKGRLQRHLANHRSSSLRSNTLSECSGRSHLSEPEPSLDDDMMNEMLEFVTKKL